MKAIRIDGNEVLKGSTHFDVLMDYMQREKLSDDATDAMIDAGRIEFGSFWWDSKTDTYSFSTDTSRQSAYRGVDDVRICRI